MQKESLSHFFSEMNDLCHYGSNENVGDPCMFDKRVHHETSFSSIIMVAMAKLVATH